METRRRNRGGRGRRKSKEFMDAALDAYIRHLALEKWREITDLQETLGVDLEKAVREAATFPQRGSYRNIWERSWRTGVIVNAAADPLFEHIEAAVRDALREEIEARKQQGDPAIEETHDYKEFVDRAMERLLEEAAGALEKF